jgi:SAM-dependent methyltransferase
VTGRTGSAAGPLVRRARAVRRTVYGAWFDLAHGVRTAEPVSGPEHGGDARSYQASESWRLTRVLPPREVTSADVFVDVGAGKGRVLLVAARRYPFRRVLGVEISPEVAEAGRLNLAAAGRAGITIDCADIRDWPVPPDASVFYLFNPFVGEVFEAFLARLDESQRAHPRTLRVVYANPTMHHTLIAARFGAVRQLRKLTLYARPPEAL